MDVLVLTSKLLGVYLGVSGLFLIFKSKTVPHLLEDFFEHRAVTYLTGIILIFLSSMYLIQYNIWTDTWHIALYCGLASAVERFSLCLYSKIA